MKGWMDDVEWISGRITRQKGLGIQSSAMGGRTVKRANDGCAES